MRKLSSMTSLILLASILALPQASAANAKAGEACARAGATSTVARVNFTCIKSGKKLVWNKVVTKPAPMPKASSTPTPTAAPTLTPQVFYKAPDSVAISTLNDAEGCAVGFDSTGKQVTTPILQARINNIWLDVKTVEIGWKKTCNDPRSPNNKYYAYAKARVESNLTLRWKFIGPVNIYGRGEAGNGVGFPFEFTIVPNLQPHAVTGNYGITWSNITSRIKDISAASWADAQSTIARNQSIPDIYKGFTLYVSPGALKTDPIIGKSAILLKRELVLYANIPRAKNVYIIATTQEEQLATQSEIGKNYPDALDPLTESLESIYGKGKGGSAAGAPWIHPKCEGSDGLRNAFGQPTRSNPSITDAVMTISICPVSADAELEGVHGVAHEYVHTIQVALHPGGNIDDYQPCWMTEGEAEWSQAVVSDDFNTYLTRTHYRPYYLSQSGANYQESTQLVWAAQDVEAYLKGAEHPGTCGITKMYALSYSLGAATVEALVSIGGSESLFALDERLSQGLDMNTSFSEIYGITWDMAMPILSQVVAEKITKAMSSEAFTYQTKP